MLRSFLIALALVLVLPLAFATSKPHVVVGSVETSHQELKIRPLLVDSKLKEYTTGLPHDVTKRLFVVRRDFHLNDSLPNDKMSAPHWLWQRGGWILVDRTTGRISTLALPDFDSYYSVAEWYRDFIAYCGLSEDGTRLSAVVMQLGRRKPLLHRPLG